VFTGVSTICRGAVMTLYGSIDGMNGFLFVREAGTLWKFLHVYVWGPGSWSVLHYSPMRATDSLVLDKGVGFRSQELVVVVIHRLDGKVKTVIRGLWVKVEDFSS